MDGPTVARTRTGAQQAGDAAEVVVAHRLAVAGWSILARNLHVGRYELDLVAVDPGPPQALVIVEVRWRRRRDYGLPEETFDRRKRVHLRAAIGRLLEDGLPDGRPTPRLPIRVDLVVVEPGIGTGAQPLIRHHRNALGG